ncbi:hypothetical protein PI23P_01325 [Polaribacter irgensii 23-P]|jgi:hypothetical protein|uniref:Uncharacterized protein n=1 Tax=Polaribacter irgensii 23-P TaxID=313594 RepID=A4C2K2_9FLAO|nr:hypothetical protein [Polaribacter irgensii]EAR11803.1 hypothetical protein PI23P_01325 [Polaribacter irgensii 23-P]
MTFLEKTKQPLFWNNVSKVAIPFFVMVTAISLLMNSWEAIFAGDFDLVNEVNFADGKWMNFWALKVFLSTFYGIYVTNKKTK